MCKRWMSAVRMSISTTRCSHGRRITGVGRAVWIFRKASGIGWGYVVPHGATVLFVVAGREVI